METKILNDEQFVKVLSDWIREQRNHEVPTRLILKKTVRSFWGMPKALPLLLAAWKQAGFKVKFEEKKLFFFFTIRQVVVMERTLWQELMLATKEGRNQTAAERESSESRIGFCLWF